MALPLLALVVKQVWEVLEALGALLERAGLAELKVEWAALAARVVAAECKILFRNKQPIRAKPTKCLTNIMEAGKRGRHEKQSRPSAARHQ